MTHTHLPNLQYHTPPQPPHLQLRRLKLLHRHDRPQHLSHHIPEPHMLVPQQRSETRGLGVVRRGRVSGDGVEDVQDAGVGDQGGGG